MIQKACLQIRIQGPWQLQPSQNKMEPPTDLSYFTILYSFHTNHIDPRYSK